MCTRLCSPPLGRERAELGVAARVVPSSRLLSGAEPWAVRAAGRELSRSPRPESCRRGWAAGARLRLMLVSPVAGGWECVCVRGVGDGKPGREQVSTAMLGSFCQNQEAGM